MAKGLNQVQLLGNLGQDPELRFTQGGAAVLRLSIATSESYKDKETNKWEEHTEWHSAVVWGKRAEGLAKIVSKGTRLHISGALRTSSWEKDGVKHYRTEIKVRDVILCDGKRQGSERSAAPTPPAARPPQQDDGSLDDDDIPF
ncbi:hypothetical protein LCGC14_0798660 [marine sediment metagenome]|uniref:Single-stranded DNA-binding protein n=1 Tax=marine sediment metagenome TaxID=412755 RepID=A0A0F9SXG5_9ZZZZ